MELEWRLGRVASERFECGEAEDASSNSQSSESKPPRSCNCWLGRMDISYSSACCESRDARRAGGGLARPFGNTELDALEPLRGCAAKSCAMTESVGDGDTGALSSRPPASTQDTRRPPRGLGIGSRISSSFRLGLSLVGETPTSLPGKRHLLSAKGSDALFCDRRSRLATGAGRGSLETCALSSGFVRYPRDRAKSSSLLQGWSVRRLADPLRSMLSVVDGALNFAFFTPRSRRNDPRTIAFATVVAASISEEAKTVRNCCIPCRLITRGTRAPVTTMRTIDMENSAVNENLRLRGMADRKMMGMGKATSRTSVMPSVTLMVRSCVYPCRHRGPGSGMTCQ
jgi:hypothetical protein